MKNKKVLWVAGGVFLGVVVLLFLAGIYYTGKIEDQIRNSVTAQEEIDVDLLRQNIDVRGIEVQLDQNTLNASEVSLKGFNYWKYVMNDQLVIDRLEIKSPEIIVVRSKEKKQGKPKSSNKRILIRDLQLSNGIFRLTKTDSVGNELFIKLQELKLTEVRIDSTTKQGLLPFKYSSYRIQGDSVSIKMNPEHFMAAEEFSIHNGKTLVRNFQISPYYSKEEFDRKIPFEKDRISLKVKTMELDSLTYSYKNDSLYLQNPLLTIKDADLHIYRNKLLPDDPRIKTLFSEKIRNAPIRFNLKQVKVTESKIQYEEKVNETGPPAKVMFTNVEGTIENLMNEQLNREDFPRTTINAKTLFMGNAPVVMDWSFDATNSMDKFQISGDFGIVTGESLNPLLKPSLGIEAEGKLESVSFTFTGNEDAAEGDVRVIYDRFKIRVMQKQGQEKNNLLSMLANLFVDNSGLSKQRTHKVEFTRDKNKSFWNYIWKGLKKGVIDALGQL